MRDFRVPDVARIAVLRANALGDFMFALPALEALRQTYPDAEIVLLGRAWHHRFPTGRPGPVDRVVAIPNGAIGDEATSDGSAERRRLRDGILAELRRERWDLAVQLHGGGRNSNPFIAGLGARCTVGAAPPDPPWLDGTPPSVTYKHKVTRLREVVALAGALDGPLEPRLEVTDGDRRE